MDQPRDQLLASSRLARHERRGARTRHLAHEFERALQSRTRAHEILGRKPRRAFGAQLRHLAQQATVLERPGHAHLELLEVEGLLHEVESAAAHRIDRRLDRAVGGHQDHRAALVASARRFEHLDPAGARQAQVGHDHVVGGVRGIAQASDRAVAGRFLVDCAEAVRERARDPAPQCVVVLDDEEAPGSGVHADALCSPSGVCTASGASGMCTRKVEPRPGSVLSSSRPPWPTTIFWACASPTPEPRCLVVKNG